MDIKDFTKQEEDRLITICGIVDLYDENRNKKISDYVAEIRQLEAERYQEIDLREKKRITQQILDKAPYDPANFTPAFEHHQSPYFAGMIIEDDNPRYGYRHYLFGKQGVSDVRNLAQVVIDWRNAAISKLYYEWDEGEKYDEQIAGQKRTGIIKKRISYGIKHRDLLTIQTGSDVFIKHDGEWLSKKSEQRETKGDINPTIDQKEAASDYRMVDIVALISKEQFRIITQQHSGCIYLTGGAGSGKTTVALHRLSYMIFNYPKKYRPERCLVVMFNRSLRNYVYQTSKDLLSNKLQVETFHSWASKAINSLGFRGKFRTDQGKGLGPIKKSSIFYHALVEYVKKQQPNKDLISDLAGFYMDRDILINNISGSYKKKVELLFMQGDYILKSQEKHISFDDAGPLLLLFQLRNQSKTIPGAISWYDHIVIDEAQDLSLIELKSLYLALSKHKSMTLCADERQRILDFVDGSGFSSFHADISSQGLANEELSVSYRSTRQIMDLASKVVNRPVQDVSTEGPEPKFHESTTESEAIYKLRGSVQFLLERDPKSLTAIICRYKKEAEKIFKVLRKLPKVRLQTNLLSFEPGIVVVNVHQVKGLEFPGVILWNPSGRNYPATANGKNLLYVAITRASKRLAIFYYEPLSSLLS